MWMSEANSKGWILSYFVSEGGSRLCAYFRIAGLRVFELFLFLSPISPEETSSLQMCTSGFLGGLQGSISGHRACAPSTFTGQATSLAQDNYFLEDTNDCTIPQSEYHMLL